MRPGTEGPAATPRSVRRARMARRKALLDSPSPRTCAGRGGRDRRALDQLVRAAVLRADPDGHVGERGVLGVGPGGCPVDLVQLGGHGRLVRRGGLAGGVRVSTGSAAASAAARAARSSAVRGDRVDGARVVVGRDPPRRGDAPTHPGLPPPEAQLGPDCSVQGPAATEQRPQLPGLVRRYGAFVGAQLDTCVACPRFCSGGRCAFS
jgi:hypothetical protein